MGAPVVPARPAQASIRPLGAAYFSEGVFANPRRGELFRHLTCVACGHRAVTWVRFRLHRQGCDALVGE